VIEKHSGVMYGVTEGIYSRNRCPINLIFVSVWLLVYQSPYQRILFFNHLFKGNEYRLLVNDRPRG
jgi:hypothetical protein